VRLLDARGNDFERGGGGGGGSPKGLEYTWHFHLGDRSSGTPDPGMVAIATILNDLCTEFGVSRTAVSA